MEQRNNYRKKAILIGVIVILVFTGIWLIVFFDGKIEKESKKNANRGEEIDDKANNKALLEYCAERYDGRTSAIFADLTHDGRDELLVYDDLKYIDPETDGIITTFFVFSLINGQVEKIDEINAGPCESVYLYEEGGKCYFVEEEASNTDVVDGCPGEISLFRYQYNEAGFKKIIEEDSFETEQEKGAWSEETRKKSADYTEKVMGYIRNSTYSLCSGMWTTESEEAPLYVETTLEQLCSEYGIKTITKGTENTANETEETEAAPEAEPVEEEEIASRGIKMYGLNARVGNETIYYTVEDDYYDSIRINAYRISDKNNTEIYRTSGYPTVGYIYPYKTALYGIGENMVYRVYGKDNFEPLLMEEIEPYICIMEDELYYVSNNVLNADGYALCSYNLQSGWKKTLISGFPKDTRILGATKSFVLLGHTEYERGGQSTYTTYVVSKSGEDTEIRLETTDIKFSWNEPDCIYLNDEGGIYKMNLASGEETDIMTAEDRIAIFGDEEINDFDFLENDLYAIYHSTLYKVDIANRSAQEIFKSASDVIADKDYLLIEGSSQADKYHMKDGIPLYYYKPESGVVMLE